MNSEAVRAKLQSTDANARDHANWQAAERLGFGVLIVAMN